jgi:hypothetical protein
VPTLTRHDEFGRPPLRHTSVPHPALNRR